MADGTIYNYFENKDAILLAIVERLTEAEMREVHFVEARQVERGEFVAEYVAHRMREVQQNYQPFKAILQETIVNPELSRRVYDEIWAPGFAVAERYFQHLMDEGRMESADPVVTARLFASPLLGLLMLRLLGDPHVTANWETYSGALADFLLASSGSTVQPARATRGETDEQARQMSQERVHVMDRDQKT